MSQTCCCRGKKLDWRNKRADSKVLQLHLQLWCSVAQKTGSSKSIIVQLTASLLRHEGVGPVVFFRLAVR